MDATRLWDDLVLVGRIARPRGLRGELVVNPSTDFPETRFARGRRVFVKTGDDVRALTIASFWLQQGRPIIGIEGVESLTAAEPLAGAELRVPISELEPLPAGTFYHHDLVGCVVTTVGGQRIGAVVSVDGDAETSRLVVKTPRGDVMIPLVAPICVAIDVAAREITIEPPAGLVDLDEAAEVGGPSRAPSRRTKG